MISQYNVPEMCQHAHAYYLRDVVHDTKERSYGIIKIIRCAVRRAQHRPSHHAVVCCIRSSPAVSTGVLGCRDSVLWCGDHISDHTLFFVSLLVPAGAGGAATCSRNYGSLFFQ